MAAANQAVVGVLRAMLTADTAQFDTGMAKANSTLKLVEKNTKQVGVEVQKLTPQAERMVKAFSGDKLLYSANNLVTAITKIGGATKLTDAEQAKANRTLTQAIEKYAAMGQVAPKAMRDLEQATRKVEQPTSFLTTKMVALGAALGTFVSNLAFQGVRAMVGFGREAFSVAGELVDLRSKTGETLESLQRMQFVAVQTGTSLDAMTNAAFMLRSRLATGGTSLLAALSDVAKQSGDMGLTTRSSADQVLTALSGIRNEQERLRLGTALFGRSYRELSAAVAEGYKEIAAGAKISTDEQIEALDEAGEAWDKWWANRKADLRSFMGELVLLPGAIASAGVPDELGMVNEALSKATKDRQAYKLETISVANAEKGYAEQLAAVQKELAALTSAQRREIEAAQQLGISNDELELKYGLTEGALRILSSSTKDYAKTTKDSAEEVKKAAEAQKAWLASISNLVPVFTKWVQVGNDANVTMQDSMALYTAMPAAINSAAASIEGRLIPAAHGLAAAFESTARAKAGIGELTEGGFISAPAAIVSEGASAEAQRITQEQTQERLEKQRDQIVAFWKSQAGALESATLGRLGTLFFGQLGHDVEGTLKAAADEAHQDFLKIQRDGKATAEELTLAFNRWREAEERATFTFGERFSQWMGGLKQTFVSVLDDMLQYFVKNFLGGLLKGMSSAKLAQGLGNMLVGGGAGAVLGGGASFAASSVAGVEAAALGGGAGAGGGLLALATNPWTIGAAGAVGLGLLIAKKGLFRGGEEAININPRRDQFFGQLQAMFGGTQFEAAVKASQKAKIPGGAAERMIGAVYSADSKNEYESAQFAFLNALQAGGLKNVRGFAMGGFVPPGVVQPAILHGGRFGEDIVPRTSANSGAKIELHQHYNTTFNSHSMNTEGFDRVFKNEFLPRLHFEYRLNQQGTVTVLEKALVR